MNLHLTHDNVFIDYVINSASTLQMLDNKFVVFTDNAEPLKFIKSNKIESAQYNSVEFWNIIGDLKQYHTVYIHWLYGNTVDFVNRLPENIKVVWCFWGGDGLELPGMLKNVYQPITYKYYCNTNHFKLLPLSFKKYRYQLYLLKMKYRFNTEHLKAIRRVNYFAHYLEEDFQLIKIHTHFNAEFIPFHYAALEKIVPINHIKRPDGNNIILGNSDTMPNNHFEAINLLSTYGIGQRKVFCPLSYEKKQYALDVAKYGNDKLGKNFIAMLDYLPKEEYDQILGSVSYGIMNHNRSQALGNILALLWNGAKLFMSENSTLYYYFKKNNLTIFNFQDSFKNKNNNVFEKLSEEDMLRNQKILLEMFGEKNYHRKMQGLLSI